MAIRTVVDANISNVLCGARASVSNSEAACYSMSRSTSRSVSSSPPQPPSGCNSKEPQNSSQPSSYDAGKKTKVATLFGLPCTTATGERPQASDEKQRKSNIPTHASDHSAASSNQEPATRQDEQPQAYVSSYRLPFGITEPPNSTARTSDQQKASASGYKSLAQASTQRSFERSSRNHPDTRPPKPKSPRRSRSRESYTEEHGRFSSHRPSSTYSARHDDSYKSRTRRYRQDSRSPSPRRPDRRSRESDRHDRHIRPSAPHAFHNSQYSSSRDAPSRSTHRRTEYYSDSRSRRYKQSDYPYFDSHARRQSTISPSKSPSHSPHSTRAASPAWHSTKDSSRDRSPHYEGRSSPIFRRPNTRSAPRRYSRSPSPYRSSSRSNTARPPRRFHSNHPSPGRHHSSSSHGDRGSKPYQKSYRNQSISPDSKRLRRTEHLDHSPSSHAHAHGTPARSQISVYETLAQVGEGTYGKVFRARHRVTGQLVALKRVRIERDRDGFPITAVRELQLLQRVRHPNIVALLDLALENNARKQSIVTTPNSLPTQYVYMVFEYMAHDLAGILQHPKVRFEAAHIKSLMQQLLSGLAFLHKYRIIHRDIKGSNLLLSRTGVLKIADFGLARAVSAHAVASSVHGGSDPAQTHAGGGHDGGGRDLTNRVITLWYRPIELLLGSTHYGGEVDLWSAGCILAEFFLHRPAFSASDEVGQIEHIYRICGAPDCEKWPGVVSLPWYDLVLPAAVHRETGLLRTRRLREFFGPAFACDRSTDSCPSDETSDSAAAALDLVDALLQLTPMDRPSAAAALKHAYFTTHPLPASPQQVLEALDESDHWHEFEFKQRKRAAAGAIEPAPGSAQSSAQPSTCPSSPAHIVSSVRAHAEDISGHAAHEDTQLVGRSLCGFDSLLKLANAPVPKSTGDAH